jgi:hypothetical protein
MKATGYGQYRTNTKNLLVHRMAWELYVGPIPAGHHLHHTCENRLCFNPDHLSLLAPGDHLRLHRAVIACPKCGSTRPRRQTFRNGKLNGTRCLDCHGTGQPTAKARNVCKNGLHEMLGGNVIWSPRGRLCRACRNAASLRAYYRRRNGQ